MLIRVRNKVINEQGQVYYELVKDNLELILTKDNDWLRGISSSLSWAKQDVEKNVEKLHETYPDEGSFEFEFLPPEPSYLQDNFNLLSSELPEVDWVEYIREVTQMKHDLLVKQMRMAREVQVNASHLQEAFNSLPCNRK